VKSLSVKSASRGLRGVFLDWLAWGRRRRVNKVLLVVSVSIAAFVTGAFAWATVFPYEGDFTRYLVFYWIWGLCALSIPFAMAEYKTSPLRKNSERGHLAILLYIGSLLIITRALNMLIYGGY
jgi:hypothetical protein